MKILWFIYPFCSIFIIVGAGLSYWTLRGYLKGSAIEQWPSTEAKITRCELRRNQDSDSVTYEVLVRYSYSVLGADYENDVVHPSYSASNFHGHQELYERLKEVQSVRIRYNEISPDESYLIAGTFTADLAAFFGGLIFLSAGFFFLLTFHFAIAGSSDYVSALDVVR